MTAYKLNALAMMTDKQLTKAGFDPKEITLEVIWREGELSQLRAEMREVAAHHWSTETGLPVVMKEA